LNAESASPGSSGRTLEQALSRLAREPHLLVACDYDGTLAPIVDVPSDARPRRESVAALRALAALADTSVAVISGRSLHDLAALSRLPEEIHLVGSHGTEFDVGFARALPAAALALRDRVTEDLHAIAAVRPGVLVEHKPAGVALHYRQASDEDGRAALAAVRDGPAQLAGVHAREGKLVIELAVVQADKGYALDAIRHQVGATAAVFVGDDVTDEDAFSRLTGPDLGIKVGLGPTFAELRVTDPEDVARLLARLVETRRDWLAGANAVPIERHALLADGKTVALVTPDARVTWLCHPRPDSAPVFAELVGGHSGGSLAVRPAHGGLPTAQRYIEGTLTLETRWAGLAVHDYLDRGEPYGRVRLVRVIEGSSEAIIEFTPRPDFGRQQIALREDPNGVAVVGAADPVVLYAPGLAWEIEEEGGQPMARAHVNVSGPYVIELRCGTWSLAPHPLPETERRERTETTWRNWAGALRLPALARQEVARSALTLRALCHEQTGAILAAATTSLPEEIGGVRNWDYRYCWLRDATLTALALVELGSNAEATALLSYIEQLAKLEQGADRLRPLYSVLGGDAGTEAVIDAVPGYAGSRPVRVGNAAAQQVQLDVFGPIVELAYAVAVAGGRLSERHHLLVEQMVDAVARRWQEPDHGIWEVRRQPRHHVHSRAMCWLAVDRAIRIARLTERPANDAWATLADRIAADVLERGWKDEVRSFTAAYDGVDLDAAALQIGLCGLLPADDERFAATVEAVELRLREGPTVYRYRSDDGLPGSEGGFHLCALWLAEAYALVGRQSDAQALFDQVLELAGPSGLLSEQYDPRAERALGNHPQAYSHLALIRTALVLDRLPG
jgi:trehalose-phosphatase